MSIFKKISIILIFLGFVLYLRHLKNFDFQEGLIPQDFSVYIKPAKLIEAGQSPYNPSDYLTYKYSPGMIPVFSMLPENPIHAWLVAKAVYLISMVLGLILFVKLEGPRTWKGLIPLGLGLVLSWKGIIEGLDFGQTEYLLIGILGVAVYFGRSNLFLLGFGIGVLPFIKLPWALLTVPFFLQLQTKEKLKKGILGLGSAIFLMAVLLPVLAFGFTKTLEYYHDWRVVLTTQPSYMFDFENANQSLWASFARWFGSDFKSLAWFVVLPLSYFVFKKSLKIQKTKEIGLGWWSRWLALILLYNPLSWRWASLLIVGLPLAWPKLEKRQLVFYLLIFLLFMFQQNPVVRLFGFTHWSKLHDYGLVTVFWFVMLIFSLREPEVK